ncbi:DNA helicase UvrD [Candidatus Berkelbacteria bacterium]|nr:DNA helicase UvrD [Candidatus Berkelbacteria bacterium]MBI2588239.1 DNA helicase UvrD [Candidatus Berkelbacteria bacterium]MBI4029560.1 DNA helicase UvrD [Candidatus Berkelbacteria bacterium]
MRIITDLHLHSKYSRATSPKLDHTGIAYWAKVKGIDIVGTGDFTHPLWLSQLKQNLTEAGEGVYKVKEGEGAFYILSAEISCIYSQGGRVRKIHTIVLVPSFAAAEKIVAKLSIIGNLYADGRPILGLSARDLASYVLDLEPKSIIIPAHAWTPHFSVFGSQSGFDSLEECFGENTKHIFALETGLSSDPEMNWRLTALDEISLVSFSDSHSPANLLREATVFELKKPSFFEISEALKNHQVAYTLEFYPEEGKYHLDGHRKCGVRLEPLESRKNKNLCPVCQRPLTIGVQNRVEELADRPFGFKPPKAAPFKKLVQLTKIIAEAIGVGAGSKKVEREYQKIIQQVKSEFAVLVDLSLEDLSKIVEPKIVEGIKRTREGDLIIEPGFDGEFGKVKIFDNPAPEKPLGLF